MDGSCGAVRPEKTRETFGRSHRVSLGLGDEGEE